MANIQNLRNIAREKSLPDLSANYAVFIAIVVIISLVGATAAADTVPSFMQLSDSEDQCTKVVTEANCCSDEYDAINKRFAPLYDALKWPDSKASKIISSLDGVSCACKAPEYKEVATVENGQCVLEEIKLAE